MLLIVINGLLDSMYRTLVRLRKSLKETMTVIKNPAKRPRPIKSVVPIGPGFLSSVRCHGEGVVSIILASKTELIG